MSPEIYQFLERASPVLILWSFAFTIVHCARIARRLRRGIPPIRDNSLFTELAGLLLTGLQTVAFVMAVVYADWRSMLLFAWWGPGFVIVVVLLTIARICRRRIDWRTYRLPISYACKLYYLAYMVVFLLFDMPGMIFAFSAWIANDQVEKAFMSLDADRTRRTFHDLWLFRILYPAGLFVPIFFANTPLRWFAGAYGLTVFGLWMAGLVIVARRGEFFRVPPDPSLLRNMMYFSRLRIGDSALEVVAGNRAAPEKVEA